MPRVAPEKSPAERMATPIQFVKGVGPQRAEILSRLELTTVREVLFNFPRDYQDMSELRPIEQLIDGQAVSVCGVIDEVDIRNTGPGRSMLGVLLRQGTQYLRALWFNQPYLADKFRAGQRVLISGSPQLRGFRWEMVHPRVAFLADDEESPAGQILPVYSLTEGISQAQMRRIVRSVVEQFGDAPEEVLPGSFLAEHELPSITDALSRIHLPTDRRTLDHARHRFIFQELLVMQLALAWRRWRLVHQRRAPALPADARIDARITRLFPFELTADQRQAMQAIGADMGNTFPMNRLVHGEVGSGKTVVAQYAMLLCVAHGHQAVLMAPTEVLARQHSRSLARALEQSRVRIALLTGGLTPLLRRETLASIAEGKVDIVVGTHAVLSDDVKFANLGLVIIDEQHKFGVRQRAVLRQAGFDPHYLVMTATPIPRTISLTLFGDLDVSTLRVLPPGRQTVHTYLAGEDRRTRWWQFVREKLNEGRQAYVIAPLVEESENIDAASAEQLFENLANGELADFRLDILHGRQSAEEKDQALERFRRGEVQVLVSTLVVEVGVDIPNATLMTIEGAERFGLAQLHQLRGRVSRGVYPGYVCMFTTSETEEARERLEAFCKMPDGFEVAELDFKLRGPGNVLGFAQHGLPPLRIADLVRDADVVQKARNVAQQLISTDPELTSPIWEKLRRMVLVRYGQVMELADIG